MEDTYSIARDISTQTIRKSAYYATIDGNRLIAYARAVAQETPEGVEPSTYSAVISLTPQIGSWQCKKKWRAYTKWNLGVMWTT